MEIDILEEINNKYGSMTKGQRQIATFVTAHYDKAAFLPAKKLGAVIGVSESTVVRFATFLGFPGYNEFQTAVAKRITEKLGFEEHDEPEAPIQKTEPDYKARRQSKTLAGGVLSRDIMNIEQTLRDLNPKVLDNAATLLYEARTVYIVGLRTCLPLAQFFGFYLSMLRPNVVVVGSTDLSETFEKMVHVGEEDVVVGISFPNYSVRTLRAMEFANERRARLIAITDSVYSPLILYSSCNLFAKSDLISIVDSMTAPISLINALMVQMCEKYKKTLDEKLKTLGDAWDNYQSYEQDAIGAKYYYPEEDGSTEEKEPLAEEYEPMASKEKEPLAEEIHRTQASGLAEITNQMTEVKEDASEELIDGQMDIMHVLSAMEGPGNEA